MSEAVLAPPFEMDAHDEARAPRATLAAVALVSFASLLLELSLTRLFSVVLFYHFAFLAISVALLGLGAGGVFAYVLRRFLGRFRTSRLGTLLMVINAAVTVAALEVVLRVPVSLELTRRNFRQLSEIYLASAVPFFLVGMLFAVVFARQSRRIGMLYGADLLGGAAACLAVVPVLNLLGGPNAVLVAAAAMAGAGVLWAGCEGDWKLGRWLAAGVALVVLAGIGVNFRGRLVDIVYAKGMRRDKPWMLFARWNAISRVEVNQVGESRYIVIDADASSAIMNVDPKRWAEDQRPTPHDTGLPHESTYNWKRDLMAAAPAIANVLRPKGEFAIIGPGGGVDVLRAAANGSPNVTGIEINPIIANTIMRDKYADYAYHLYELPQVHIHVSDGRSWIRASHEKYDVVQMTLVDTWASTAAGAFALSENNLYTLQAFRKYFDHLKPDGLIAITRWEFAKPREALRVVSEEMAAMQRSVPGFSEYASHFLVVADGALDADGRPVTVVVKKSAFTDGEIDAVLAHVAENPNLFVIYVPGRTAEQIAAAGAREAAAEAVKPFRDLITQSWPASTVSGEPQWAPFVKSYAYNIAPVDDNAPFFFFTLKTRDVLRDTLKGTGRGMDWRVNLGLVVLGVVLLMSVGAVLLFLIVPLAIYQIARASRALAGRKTGVPRSARDDRPRQGGAGSLLYFVALGLGYILVEVTMIQRFCLFLGHPTYALTVVVFLMLLSSGAGSVASRRLLGATSRVRVVLGGIAAGVVGYCFLLPLVLASLVGLPFLVKLLLSGLLLAPLGFAMGMPFPTGLRALAASAGGAEDDTHIEWAWAMNAAASVLGSVLAMVLAIHFGLTVTLASGAGAYLAAGLALPLLPRARQAD